MSEVSSNATFLQELEALIVRSKDSKTRGSVWITVKKNVFESEQTGIPTCIIRAVYGDRTLRTNVIDEALDNFIDSYSSILKVQLELKKKVRNKSKIEK